MSYTLHIDHTHVNYRAGNSGRKYIVIHYTGNPSDAAAGNANYFRTTYRGASANYFVDPTDVYEVVAPDNTSWAVGVNYGHNNLFGICTNENSINIEMCSTNSAILQATVNNTIELTKKLMARYGIPVSNVVRHWDVCSKRCPGWAGWLPGDESKWNAFKAALTASTTVSKPKPKPTYYTANAHAVFRAYNPNSGEHVFTTDLTEANSLMDAGWKNEGIGWHETGSTKIYRMYANNEHVYLKANDEYAGLDIAGWKGEKVAFLASDKPGDGLYPVFRLYNKTGGHHMYTISEKERDTLVKAGWKLEGIAFYEHE